MPRPAPAPGACWILQEGTSAAATAAASAHIYVLAGRGCLLRALFGRWFSVTLRAAAGRTFSQTGQPTWATVNGFRDMRAPPHGLAAGGRLTVNA